MELLFKQWKARLSLHVLKGTHSERIQCLWYGRFITIASTAFRKFVLSYGRLFGHEILGYREQSRDEFSRPFGKDTFQRI